MASYLEFEKPVADLDGQIKELRTVGQNDQSVDLSDEIQKLEKNLVCVRFDRCPSFHMLLTKDTDPATLGK